MGRNSKPDSEKLSKTVAFRLTEGDFQSYERKFAASGLNQSEFFREHVLTNSTKVIARPIATADTKRIVFLMQKASNNINQLAHRANAEHLAGVLSDATFRGIVSQLEQLNSFLVEQTSAALR